MSPQWGGTIEGIVDTWRSGLGVSADGKTLFFFAGKAKIYLVMLLRLSLPFY